MEKREVIRRKKLRIDKLLVERGLVESREKAVSMIMAGEVIINGKPILKPGTFVDEGCDIKIERKKPAYIGRGGIKLEGALDAFSIDVRGKVIMDVGASTGGFTHCLLMRGAERVYAIDVGYGQLAWVLRQDPRVVVMERTNIRYLPRERIKEEIHMATIDVSFISLEKVIPKVIEFLKKEGEIVALIKPQFEVGKGEVGKGGIVREIEKHIRVIERIKSFCTGLGLKVMGIVKSPIPGADGNTEYFIYLKKV